MRCTQIMGLNKWATKFVAGEEKLAYTERVVRVYPDGHLEARPDRPVLISSVKREPLGEHYEGMFEGEVFDLYRYTLPDGRVLVEKVQAGPWSSGPVIFLALQDADGKWVPASLWSDEEIANA